ncbi:MAG: hypothetical protein ACI9KE_003967 [Polyangiales bacterium]|jgi:hypothetical protein
MDLLAGELPPEEADSLRTAIKGCDDCGPEFEMMALLMDFSGPALKATAPKEIDAVIMAAAKEHAEHRVTSSPVSQTPGIWARLGEWLESIALGPQFAMATVMVLVVAVGFWYVPKHESHEVAGSTVVLSDPEGEAVAADDPGLVPALIGAGERNQEAVGDLGEIERVSTNREERGTEPETPPELQGPPPEATQTMRQRPARNRDTRAAQREQPEQPELSVQTQTTMAMTRGATRMTVPSDRVIANQGTDDVENLQAQSAAWARELEGVPMPSYSDEAPVAPGTGGLARPSARQAPSQQAPARQAEAADFEQAEEAPAPSVSASRALLQLARNHRSQARCDQAVRHYESLLARFASSPEVPPALMESADCYRRMGRISDAERALQRALQFASTRTNARRELARLETIRAAQRETNAPSSESFESAY